MHILVTADTLGGVWTYTRELVTGLLGRGVQVTLVSFGSVPTPGQTRWMVQSPGLDGRGFSHCGFRYYPTAFKLEWMQDSAAGMEASAEYLRGVIRETRPDLLHLNQFYYGDLGCDLPRVVVAHSDVVSWWVAVHGHEPPPTNWMNWYRSAVTRGLAQATAVIAPSQWMLEQVERHYLKPGRASVIYNGRTPALFNPHLTKEEKIVTVGRLWDHGKNARLLLRTEMPALVSIVGAHNHPEARGGGFLVEDAGPSTDLQPAQDEKQIVQILGRAAIYAAPSQYEPFGLAPLEAALSRCALVASDIPSFRELWDGAAVFFRNNDAQDLRHALELLVRDPVLRRERANLAYSHALRKFSVGRMIDDYIELYRALAPAAVAAA